LYTTCCVGYNTLLHSRSVQYFIHLHSTLLHWRSVQYLTPAHYLVVYNTTGVKYCSLPKDVHVLSAVAYTTMCKCNVLYVQVWSTVHYTNIFYYSSASRCVFHATNKRKYAVQHNTVMSYHTPLHVSVRMNHNQTILVTTILRRDTFEQVIIVLVMGSH
jgi:hypothetical protein